MGRISDHIRRHVVGYVAVFIALSGTAMALPGRRDVQANDLQTNAVGSRAIAHDAVTGHEVENRSLTGTDIRSGGIGAEVLENGLIGTPQLRNGAVTNPKLRDDAVDGNKVLDQSLAGADIVPDSLTGDQIDEKTLSLDRCAEGQVRGFANVRPDLKNFPYTWTSDPRFVRSPYNCSGDAVEVRRFTPNGDEFWAIRFRNNPATVATVSGSILQSAALGVTFAAEQDPPDWNGDPSAFVVAQYDRAGLSPTQLPFVIVVY